MTFASSKDALRLSARVSVFSTPEGPRSTIPKRMRHLRLSSRTPVLFPDPPRIYLPSLSEGAPYKKDLREPYRHRRRLRSRSFHRTIRPGRSRSDRGSRNGHPRTRSGPPNVSPPAGEPAAADVAAGAPGITFLFLLLLFLLTSDQSPGPGISNAFPTLGNATVVGTIHIGEIARLPSPENPSRLPLRRERSASFSHHSLRAEPIPLQSESSRLRLPCRLQVEGPPLAGVQETQHTQVNHVLALLPYSLSASLKSPLPAVDVSAFSLNIISRLKCSHISS